MLCAGLLLAERQRPAYKSSSARGSRRREPRLWESLTPAIVRWAAAAASAAVAAAARHLRSAGKQRRLFVFLVINSLFMLVELACGAPLLSSPSSHLTQAERSYCPAEPVFERLGASG
jgi:hypothetical protein